MSEAKKIGKGALLVAGTSIGGGMLALPVLTSEAGFYPSLVIYVLCWFFMMSTGLLFLEVCLWTKEETNIISMAEKTLGSYSKIVVWILYLFLFYCLTLAYIVGCGQLFASLFQRIISNWQGSLFFVLLFSPFVYLGAHLVSRINIFLMIGLIGSFVVFLILGYRYVELERLEYSHWLFALNSMPIAFTSFAYQGIVPTLTRYLHYNTRQIRLAIILGSLIPLVTYIIWEWLILGIVPIFGPESLSEALNNGQTAIDPLRTMLKNPIIYLVGQCFAFFAMVTSFLGVSLGLVDFLADGLKISKTSWNTCLLCLLVFVPPLFFAYTHPHVFLKALDYAGGFGCALLLGVLPILMVWVGRYHLHLKAPYQLLGGKKVLFLLLVFVGLELTFECYHLFNA
jgi:tyrosine-specific transport protein